MSGLLEEYATCSLCGERKGCTPDEEANVPALCWECAAWLAAYIRTEDATTVDQIWKVQPPMGREMLPLADDVDPVPSELLDGMRHSGSPVAGARAFLELDHVGAALVLVRDIILEDVNDASTRDNAVLVEVVSIVFDRRAVRPGYLGKLRDAFDASRGHSPT